MNTPRTLVILALACAGLDASAKFLPLAASTATTATTTTNSTTTKTTVVVVPPVTPPVTPPVLPPVTPPPPRKVPAIRKYPPPHFGDNRIKPGVLALFGDPLPNLTIQQMNQFLDGRDGFVLPQTVVGGLGPIFNRSSCVECHSSGGIGGGSVINATRFALNLNGRFDSLEALGGSLLQERTIHPLAQEFVPRSANVVILRNSTPLFGLGLIEAIPDGNIISNRRNYGNDQIHGRVNIVTDVVSGKPMVGRFGWKAQHATLTAFSADAYLNEMGITNKHFRVENAPNGNLKLLESYDSTLDPEDQGVGGRMPEFEMVAHFMRLLGAPPVKPAPAGGLALFSLVGCAQCHTPTLRTGPNTQVAALNYKDVSLYSDLLLHNMGTLGDGIFQAGASGSEIRTPPLWGARMSAPYLHDGRAPTIDAAIRAHEGEGRIVRDRYLKLNAAQQKLLADFVLSL